MTFVLLTSMLVLADTDAARSAGTCDEFHDGSYFDGSVLQPNQYSGRVNGTRSDMTARDPALCSGGTTNRYASAWVSITNFSDGLIQVGYWKHRTPDNTNVLRFFAEWFLCDPYNDPSCNHQQEWKTISGVGTMTDGSTYSFRVLRDAGGTNKVDMKVCTVGGSSCSTLMTADDPYAGSGWGSAARAFQTGETQNLQTDMPGTQAAKASFDEMQAYIGDQGSWATYDFSFCAYHSVIDCNQGLPSRYNETWANNPPRDHLRIWTDPL